MPSDEYIRSKAIHNAMQLMGHQDPMQALAQLMVIARVLENHECGRELFDKVEVETPVEGPTEDAMTHTGNGQGSGETQAAPAQQAEVAEAVQIVGDRIKKAVSSRKAKSAKNGKTKRTKPARDEVGAVSQDFGSTTPETGSHVPGDDPLPNGDASELPVAA